MPGKGRSPFYYGWVVLAVSAGTLAITYTFRYSFSFLFVAILDEFGWKRADTAGIFALNVLSYGLLLPFVGAALDRFGPRRVISIGALVVALASVSLGLASSLWHFYVLYGMVLAVGIALTGWVPNSTVVSAWFAERRGLALGVLSTGVGVTYVLSSLSQYAIAGLGWRQAYLLMGLFMALTVLPGVVLLHRPLPWGSRDIGLVDPEPGAATAPPQAAIQWTLRRALKTRRFWFFFFSVFLIWGVALNLMLAHHIVFMRDIGFQPQFTALVYLTFGLCFIAGNSLGFLSDRIGREATITLGASLAILGVLFLLWASYSPQARLLFLYAVALGLGAGICSPTITAGIADVFGGRSFGAINGFITTAYGVGGALSPWLGGYIYDRWGTYNPAFALVAGAFSLSAVFYWLAAPRRHRSPAARSAPG